MRGMFLSSGTTTGLGKDIHASVHVPCVQSSMGAYSKSGIAGGEDAIVGAWLKWWAYSLDCSEFEVIYRDFKY